MKFNVDASEDNELFGKSLMALYASAVSRVRRMGYVLMAKPSVPDIVKPLLECEVDGHRMYLNDRRLEGETSEDLRIVPPADVSKMDLDQIGHLIQYMTAEVAYMSSELINLETLQNLAKLRLNRLVRMVEIDLSGRKNTDTGRAYTEKARKELSKVDVRVLQAEVDHFEAQTVYKVAQSVTDGWKRIVEALNRNRMVRSDEANLFQGSPADEHGYDETTKRMQATKRRLQNRRYSGD